jgi:hypothetical protein
MLPLIIVYSIKIRSFANGHGGVSRRARHMIVIKRYIIIGGLIALFLVPLCFVGGFLFI